MLSSVEKNRKIFAVLFFVIISVVVFDGLQVYRNVVFKSLPHDDYGRYLQYIVTLGGEGHLPASPWKERIGSILLSVPFSILPAVDFSGKMLVAAEMRPYYLALSIANSFYFYGGWAIVFAATFFMPDKKYLRTFENICILFITLLISRQVLVLEAMDGVGLFLVALAFALAQNRMYKALVIYAFVALVFNEKVTVVIFAFIFAEGILGNSSWRNSIIVSMALLIYFVYRSLVPNGGGVQTSFDFSDKIYSFFITFIHPRGVVLNFVPLFICSIYVFAARSRAGVLVGGLILFFLLVVSIQAQVVYNVGRILIYGIPFFFFYLLRINCNFRAQPKIKLSDFSGL